MFWGLRSRWTTPDPVGLRQPLADLLGDVDRLARRQRPGPADEPLQVLAGHVFHRDVMEVILLAQVVHPADVPVGDLPGDLELVLETLDGLVVDADLRPDELQGQDLADLAVVGLEDLAHPPLAERLDDLVAAGEEVAAGDLESLPDLMVLGAGSSLSGPAQLAQKRLSAGFSASGSSGI